MIHLFDSIYIEQEKYIDVNFDRVVISKKNFNNSASYSTGKLLLAIPDLGSLLDLMTFSSLIEMLYVRHKLTGNKIVIYCDEEFISFYCLWCKHIFPNIDFASFKQLVSFSNHNQLLANMGAPMQSNHTELDWDSLTVVPSCQLRIREMMLSHSYEFLMLEYLQGHLAYLDIFKKKFHYFLRKWFEEALTDNRLMILYNLYNHNFQNTLDFSNKDFDINNANLLANIPSMKYYSDEEIWFRHGHDKIDLSGLSQEKIDGIRETILTVYRDCEHMATNQTCFILYQWLEVAVRENITNDELKEIFECFMTYTFDTCGVPRHDFKTVNFPLLMFILNCKKDNKLQLLDPYRLL